MRIAHHRAQRTSAFAQTFLCGVAVLFAGCGGGGGDSSETTPPGSSLQTLTGLVLRPSGLGLEGVTVSAGTASALSNADGEYILTTAGMFSRTAQDIHFDGSSAGFPGQFPELHIVLDLPGEGSSVTVPQVITLPDLMNPMSSNQTVETDANGATASEVSVTGLSPDIVLSGPAGTVITVDGAPASQVLELNMTPVDPSQVPMLLPDDLVGGGFVTIQPGNGRFDPPGPAEGLDVLLPNDQNLPVGATMDIWSFDHDDGAWVNRSAETGNQGTVVAVAGGGTAVQAGGVITEGGWHAGVIDADPDCATTFTVRVVDTSSGVGIPGAIVVLFSGQTATTDADGRVSIPLVPAYDLGLLNGPLNLCEAIDLSYFIYLPASAGFKFSGLLVVPAASVVPGGVTDAGEYDCEVPNEGNLSGLVIGTGVSMTEPVRIRDDQGPVTQVVPGPGGSFFVMDMEPGDYIASYDFIDPDPPVEVSFAIVANQTTSITLQSENGTGSEDITVFVYSDGAVGDGLPGVPLEGATVTLQGTDAGSIGGLSLLTGSDGRVSFSDVSGPFNVTAQKEISLEEDSFLRSASVIGVEPLDGTIGVQIENNDLANLLFLQQGLVFWQGEINNMPTLGSGERLFLHASSLNSGGGRTLLPPSEVGPSGAFTTLVGIDSEIDALITRQSASGDVIESAFDFDIGVAATTSGFFQADVDWPSGATIPWGQPVSVTTSNVNPNSNEFLAQLLVTSAPERAQFAIELSAGSTAPATVMFPDVAQLVASGISVEAQGLVDPNSSLSFGVPGQGCREELTATPAALTFDFLTGSTPLQPTGVFTQVTQLEFEDYLFLWDLQNTGATADSGFEKIHLFSSAPSSSGSATPILSFWELTTRGASSGLQLPRRALPATTPGATVVVTFQTQRFEGTTLDFNGYHNGAIGVNAESVLAAAARSKTASSLSLMTITQ